MVLVFKEAEMSEVLVRPAKIVAETHTKVSEPNHTKNQNHSHPIPDLAEHYTTKPPRG